MIKKRLRFQKTHVRPQSFTIIYCFLSGTHTYIDGTKDWKMMKKRLRFELPHTPLKVLRGEQDQVDIQDQYYERFQAPATTTEDTEDGKDIDDDSRRSSLSRDDVTTDLGEVSEESVTRYLGGVAGSVDTVNDPPNAPEYPPNAPEYHTTGSINLEATDVQVTTQVHYLSDSDETSNDDTAPLLDNMH